ncbi:MAG: pyridoxamine 5'-phosphate oxidase family protein [Chloroflexota bacterium]
MDTPLATARIVRFLEQEPVVWLSTVRPDGQPHLVPTWFWWDGEALLVFSRPDARKVRNLRTNPSVMLGLGDAEKDFDIGLVEARAELIDRPTAKVLPAAHLDKYADQLRSIGLTPAEYAATYSQVIRIVPRGFLGWHGRTTPRSVRVAGAPSASLAEPRRESFDAGDGEPVAAGRRIMPAPRIVPPARLRPSVLRRVGAPIGRGLRELTDGFGRPQALPAGSL